LLPGMLDSQACEQKMVFVTNQSQRTPAGPTAVGNKLLLILRPVRSSTRSYQVATTINIDYLVSCGLFCPDSKSLFRAVPTPLKFPLINVKSNYSRDEIDQNSDRYRPKSRQSLDEILSILRPRCYQCHTGCEHWE
jgi:hypothetical protein